MSKLKVDYCAMDYATMASSIRGVDRVSNKHKLTIKRKRKMFEVYRGPTILGIFARFEDAQDFIDKFSVN